MSGSLDSVDTLRDVEDWRLCVIPSRTGWAGYLILDDGVLLVEAVDVGEHPVD